MAKQLALGVIRMIRAVTAFAARSKARRPESGIAPRLTDGEALVALAILNGVHL